MNCQDFETSLTDVARDRLMDVAARDRAMAHVEHCPACSAFLEEERRLSDRLRALSVETAAEEVPARLESSLLEAFRQRNAAPALAPPDPAPGGRRRWLLAVAALALLTFGLSLAAWLSGSEGQKSFGSSLTVVPPSPPPVAPPITPETPEQKQAPESVAAVADPPRRNSEVRTPRRRSPHANLGDQPASNDAPREYVTQFYPVLQGGDVIPLESAQIVRVRMPRANLIPLGIPVNQARADETIQAEVLVSNEGLARAIRLVY
jgi:hypothetical protein